MGGIRQSGTEPELSVRAALTNLGLRYRLRNRDLPGSPDLANRTHRWVIFVHGCYWHRHTSCKRTTTPKRNRTFWERKFRDNVARDARASDALRGMGFAVVTVWECETRVGVQALSRLLRERLRRQAVLPLKLGGSAIQTGGRHG